MYRHGVHRRACPGARGRSIWAPHCGLPGRGRGEKLRSGSPPGGGAGKWQGSTGPSGQGCSAVRRAVCFEARESACCHCMLLHVEGCFWPCVQPQLSHCVKSWLCLHGCVGSSRPSTHPPWVSPVMASSYSGLCPEMTPGTGTLFLDVLLCLLVHGGSGASA